MGFRNYDPGLNQFASRDMYDGALDNMSLTTDPFTGSQYAFGNGNPISNIETNGHSSCPPPTINCGGSTPSEYVDLPAGEPSPAVAGALNGLPSVINGAARTAQTQKIDNESNFANNLALATSWIPDADEGTSIAAGFFQVLKGGNAIQDGDTTGGIGDLANGAPDVAGGKILEGLGSLAGKGVSTVSRAVAGEEEGGELFSNKMPEMLDQELATAERLGVEPTAAGSAGFDSALSMGTIKWAVLEDGTLVVTPKFVDGVEIYHSVLSGGAPVRAAGEADVAGSAETGYYGLGIDNHSGHFLPSQESLQIGIDAFNAAGIQFP
jgi:hypothetical protein